LRLVGYLERNASHTLVLISYFVSGIVSARRSVGTGCDETYPSCGRVALIFL